MYEAPVLGMRRLCNVESIIRVIKPRVRVKDVCHCNIRKRRMSQALTDAQMIRNRRMSQDYFCY